MPAENAREAEAAARRLTVTGPDVPSSQQQPSKSEESRGSRRRRARANRPPDGSGSTAAALPTRRGGGGSRCRRAVLYSAVMGLTDARTHLAGRPLNL